MARHHVSLLCFCCLCAVSHAQEPNATDEAQSGVFAPNPPSCAAEWADMVLGVTDFAAGIVAETSLCAQAMGWHGQTIYGDKKLWPNWHNERGCALAVISTITTFCGITGSALSASFDCFNNDQGCAQTIVSTIQILLSIGSTLISATAACAPPGIGPPYYSMHDQPIAAFNCYRKVWHIVQRLIKVSKYIDLTIQLCPSTVDPAFAAAGSPLAALALGAGEELADAINGTNTNSSDAVVWNRMEQQQAFAAAEDLAVVVSPVERRLDELQKLFPSVDEVKTETEEEDEVMPEHFGPGNALKIVGDLLDTMLSTLHSKQSIRPQGAPLQRALFV